MQVPVPVSGRRASSRPVLPTILTPSHLSSPPAQISLRTPLSLSGRPGLHKLSISNGLHGFCLLLMGSSSAPCLHRWPVQAPLSLSPQILLLRTVRSASTGCSLDPIPRPLPRFPALICSALRSRHCAFAHAVPAARNSAHPQHTARSRPTAVFPPWSLPGPPCGLQSHLLKSDFLTGHSSASHHPWELLGCWDQAASPFSPSVPRMVGVYWPTG